VQDLPKGVQHLHVPRRVKYAHESIGNIYLEVEDSLHEGGDYLTGGVQYLPGGVNIYMKVGCT
jgi:hypothetical protein